MAQTEMQGKVCLVTGANAGLGKATALGLAKLGATVILGCRDKQRGESTQAKIRAASENERVDLLLVDLSVLDSVRAMTTEFEKRYERLDVLINNAAVFKGSRTVTEDGLETMFATNHLGPFLLTNLLLERLKTSAPSRILTITAPSTTKLNFDDLQGEKKFQALAAFGASKACNLLFTYELARRFKGTGVSANAIHPGLVKSALMKEAVAPVRWITSLISTDPEKAAEAVVYYASSPEKDREKAAAHRKEYQRGWYQRHKDKVLKRRLEKRRKRELDIRDWFRTYKSELYCMKCGENHPACLQFHHKDREEKSFTISNAVLRGTSIKTLIKEIRKCDVLCVNCHAKLHWRETHETDRWGEVIPSEE